VSAMARVLLVLATCLFTANVAATVVALRNAVVPKGRRALQIVFVWLVPVVGAALVIYFATEYRWVPAPEPPDLASRGGGDYSGGGGPYLPPSDSGHH
jgi:hypothetical protein